MLQKINPTVGSINKAFFNPYGAPFNQAASQKILLHQREKLPLMKEQLYDRARKAF